MPWVQAATVADPWEPSEDRGACACFPWPGLRLSPSTCLVLLLNPNYLRAEDHGPCVTPNPVNPFSNAFEPAIFS